MVVFIGVEGRRLMWSARVLCQTGLQNERWYGYQPMQYLWNYLFRYSISYFL